MQPEVDHGEPVVGYNAVENAPEHRAERKTGGGRKEANRFPRENGEEIRLGEILISEDNITGEQLEQALELQKRDQ